MIPIFAVLTALTIAIGTIASILQIVDVFKNNTKKKRFLLILIPSTVVLTILFSYGAISSPQPYGYQNNPTSNVSQSQMPTATPTPSPTPTPTPSPTPVPKPGDILYQAGQSNGWQGWSGSNDWKVSSDGLLTNDGTSSGSSSSSSPTITAPYSLGDVTDYAVEMQMQLVTTLDPSIMYGNYPYFYMLIRGISTSQGWGGYQAGFYSFYPPYNAWIKGLQDNGPIVSAPFDPGKTEHTYRLEVKGDTIKFLIDGGLKVQTTDLRYSSGGQVGLKSFDLQLAISSFKIIAL